jgi:hypothetical protein
MGVPPADLSFSVGRYRQFISDKTGEDLYLIGVFDNSIITLAHECAHATFYCGSEVGVTVKTDGANETYCYLLDRMFSYFLPHIKQDYRLRRNQIGRPSSRLTGLG